MGTRRIDCFRDGQLIASYQLFDGRHGDTESTAEVEKDFIDAAIYQLRREHFDLGDLTDITFAVHLLPARHGV